MALLWLFLALVAADEHLVLPPKDGQSTTMLVLIPGGKVPNQHYLATAEAIQEALARQGVPDLWVVIPSVFQRLCIISCATPHLCSPLQNSVQAALDMAKKKGWQQTEELWLAGHSLGATCANQLFQAYGSYRGLMVMGGYVDERGDFDLVHYPVPVLSLNVELDGGLARVGKISTWWRQFLTVRSTSELLKPVIVLPSLNHSNFCPGFDVPGDLQAEVPQADATRTIAETVAAFLILHGNTTSEAATKLLRRRLHWTEQLMKPYLEAQRWERDASNHTVSTEGTSLFCAVAQQRLTGLQGFEVQDGFHVSSPNLEHCHPKWTKKGDSLLVTSCSHTNYYPDLSNTGKITAASEIGCKMLSSTRIEEQLQVKAQDDHLPCMEMNRFAVQLAELLAAPSTLRRYRAKGRPWCFLPDSSSFAGPIWVFKDRLQLHENRSCMAVQSPSMLTELNAKIYPGIHYCKLLSPARALDWMMTDSLKPGPAEEELFV